MKRDSRSLCQARKTRNKAFPKEVILAVYDIFILVIYFEWFIIFVTNFYLHLQSKNLKLKMILAINLTNILNLHHFLEISLAYNTLL